MMGEQQIFNLMIEFFEEDNWEFQWVTGLAVLSMGYRGENGRWICYAQAREAQQQFVFYSVLAVNTPPEKRPDVAEYITRANYGMVIGNWELDYSDGEIRYKTSIDVEGSELTMPLIRQVVYANLFLTDRYLPGIMRVIYGDVAPEDAIAEVDLVEDVPEDFDETLPDMPEMFDEDEEDPFDYLDKYDDEDEDMSDDDDDSDGSPPNDGTEQHDD